MAAHVVGGARAASAQRFKAFQNFSGVIKGAIQ